MRYLIISFFFYAGIATAQSPKIISGSSPAGPINLKASDGDKNILPENKPPVITWLKSYSREVSNPEISIEVNVESDSKIFSVSLEQLSDEGNDIQSIENINENTYRYSKNIQLQEGSNRIIIKATNSAGIGKSIPISIRFRPQDPIYNRKDYALLFAVEDYDNKRKYEPLQNPLSDAEDLAKKLESSYGFYSTKIVPNPSVSDLIEAFEEYSAKSYGPYDQLVIFFSGHGVKQEQFKNRGLFALKNSQGASSCMSQGEFLEYADAIDCDHILVVADACFSGRMKQYNKGDMSGKDEIVLGQRFYNDKKISHTEYMRKALEVKSRIFIASGSEKVFAGLPGENSPFVYKFLEAMGKGNTNKNGFLEYAELWDFLFSSKNIKPESGVFGSGNPNATILFEEK